MKVKSLPTSKFISLSFAATLNLSIQKYLLNQKSTLLPRQHRMARLRPHVKRFLNERKLTTHRFTSTQESFNSPKFNTIYDIVHPAFYINQVAWYTKFIYIVGQPLSGFAFDLKSSELASPNDSANQLDEFAVITPRTFKWARGKQSTKNKVTINNRKISSKKVNWQHTFNKRIRHIVYKSKSVILKKVNYKAIINKSMFKTRKSFKFGSRSFLWKKQKHSKKSTKALRGSRSKKVVKNISDNLLTKHNTMNYFLNLRKKITGSTYKTRYVNSKIYLNEWKVPNLRHNTPYLFCFKLKNDVSVETNKKDYLSNILLNNLGNPKTGPVQRNVVSLPFKLRKGKNIRWFPYFFKQNKSVYNTLGRNSKIKTPKSNLSQLLRLFSNTKPIHIMKIIPLKKRFSKQQANSYVYSKLKNLVQTETGIRSTRYIKVTALKRGSIKKKIKLLKLKFVNYIQTTYWRYRTTKNSLQAKYKFSPKLVKETNKRCLTKKKKPLLMLGTRLRAFKSSLCSIRKVRNSLKKRNTRKSVKKSIKKRIHKLKSKQKLHSRFLKPILRKSKFFPKQIKHNYTKSQLIKSQLIKSHKRFQITHKNTLILKRARGARSKQLLWGLRMRSYKALVRLFPKKNVLIKEQKRKILRKKVTSSIPHLSERLHLLSSLSRKNLKQSLVYIAKHALLKTQNSNVNHKVIQSIFQTKLCSRINQPLIMRSSIMFFTKILYPKQRTPYTYKYTFKKKLFSFLYPNEVRNSLMAKKKQFIFYKLIFSKNLKHSPSSFYSTRKLKKIFNYHSSKITENQQLNPFQSLNLLQSLNSQQNNSQYQFRDFTQELIEVDNNESFKLRGESNSFKLSEVKIPRVQFKPGYQRMWRKARSALKESLRVKFLYQQKLSRYIVRFFRQTNYYTYSRSEMELEKIIIYSRLLPDLPTVNIFLSQSLVYLNGRSITNSKTTILQNDVVQFIISKWYYIAYRWIANWTLKRHKKFKRLVYRKGLAGRHKVMKLKKQKSYYTPHWIYLARYDISDIKAYLEVDYLTLSTCIIYNPYLLNYFAPDDTPDWRSTIYRLYNWKYIT